MLALSASLLLFGLASVPLTYVLHFFFNDEMHALQASAYQEIPTAAGLFVIPRHRRSVSKDAGPLCCPLQSINTLLTSIGTLGFLVVWILELVYSFFGSPSVFL